MKKTLYLLFICCFFAEKVLPQEVHFEVRFSEPLAVFQFLDELSVNAPPNIFRTAFNTSEFNTDKYKGLVGEYDQLNLDYSYEYTNYPYAQKIGGSTLSMLKSKLISSSTIDDFRLTSLGIIPNSDLFKLCDLLTAFEPVYQKLIYNPNKEKFDRQLNAISTMANSGRLNRFFNAGLKFYDASWD